MVTGPVIDDFGQFAFNRGTDPIIQMFSPESARKIADYLGDPILSQRIDELASKCGEDALSDSERAEYEGYVRANKFLAILQAKARRFLSSGSDQ